MIGRSAVKTLGGEISNFTCRKWIKTAGACALGCKTAPRRLEVKRSPEKRNALDEAWLHSGCRHCGAALGWPRKPLPSAGVCSAFSDAISMPAMFMSGEAVAVARASRPACTAIVQSACVRPSEHDKSHTSAEAELEAIVTDSRTATAYVRRHMALFYVAYASVQSAIGKDRY